MSMASVPLKNAPLEISGKSFHLGGLDFDMAWRMDGYLLFDYRAGMSPKSFIETTVKMEINGRLSEAGEGGLDWPLKISISQTSLDQTVLK